MAIASHPRFRSAPLPGLDIPALTAWLSRTIDELEPPVGIARLPGGHSNLTFRVTDAHDRCWVLRRPPLGCLPQSAHDVAGEFRIIARLAAAGLCVPQPIAVCEHTSVTGAPFSVLEYVHGVVINDRGDAQRLDPEARRRAGLGLARALAELHAIDIDAAGLGDLASRTDYVPRQLRRWRGRWEACKTRELPQLERVAARLEAGTPVTTDAALVHGAFRLDNVILDQRHGRVQAVVDWELSTLGDPLADLGLLLTYWPQSGDQILVGDPPVTVLPGFPTREELIETYALASDREIEMLPFYRALGAWKAAIVAESVHRRHLEDPRNSGENASSRAKHVEVLAGLAEEATWRAGL